MSKQELASAAGVSIDTLRRWLEPYSGELQQMGYKPNMRILPPRIVQFICEKLCIDV
ncbi:MAG: hypothetical protein J6E48_10560 [Prevotella sp.]|nr:hypothetical protein [Prevotella sp.]